MVTTTFLHTDALQVSGPLTDTVQAVVVAAAVVALLVMALISLAKRV